MNLSSICEVIYVVIAGVFSVFYGLKAVEIFLDPVPVNKPCSWKFHQFWLNFTGAVVGWVCLWFIGGKVLACLYNTCSNPIDWWDAAVAFFAFVGITGYLPMTVVALVQSIGAIVGKIDGMQK
ncbi:MAG: hypothetical protein WBM09_08720 [Gallionella sp.]